MILKKAQAGIETTRGTGVAATRKVYAQVMGSYSKSLQTFQDTTGTFFATRRAAYGREEISFSASDIATFEDLPWWAQFFIKGGVTGVSDAGTPPAYTYTFAPSPATDDLKSMTLEFNEAGNPYESTQVMVTSVTLRCDADNDNEPGWMIDVELMGRDWVTTTFTAALSDRDTETILARGTKIFIDEPGGTIGTTQILGKFINASITFNTGIHYKAFMEDISGVAANRVGRNEYTVTAQFNFEFDNDTEFAKYRSTTPVDRIIRLEREGTNIHTTVNKRMRLDLFRLIWSSWAMGDRDGNITANFSGTAFYSTTEAKLFQLAVVNALATLA